MEHGQRDAPGARPGQGRDEKKEDDRTFNPLSLFFPASLAPAPAPHCHKRVRAFTVERIASSYSFTHTHAHTHPLPPLLFHSKKKAGHKAAGTDDKRLQSTLKRLGVHAIGGIEEVTLFGPGEGCTVYTNPKVQASIGSNTFVVSGPSAERTMEEMLPAMLGSLPPEALAALAAQFKASGAGGAPGAGGEEDEDVPELEEITGDE